MEVRSIAVRKGNSPGRVRLSAEVAYDDTAVAPEEYWFEVDQSLAESLTDSGNPWLAALLPLAATLGEPLRLGKAAVDPLLLRNMGELMSIWKSWYPALSIVPIEVNTISSAETPRQMAKTVAFFSGGVDSYFTLLKHHAEETPKIDELLYVWGFDIPLENRAACRQAKACLGRVAEYFCLPLVDLATNLKQTRLQIAGWALLFHGAALASVAHALENRYANALIPSTQSYARLLPWGSHPLTDPLFSTSRTRIIHDGARWKRFQKTEMVAQSEVLLNSLRVCPVSFTEKNCGACNKCYRTMITLEILGLLRRCETFPVKHISLSNVEKVYSEHDIDIQFLEEVQSFALANGRLDIVAAIGRSFEHSARIRRWMKLPEWMKRRRLVWKWATPVERILLWRSIA